MEINLEKIAASLLHKDFNNQSFTRQQWCSPDSIRFPDSICKNGKIYSEVNLPREVQICTEFKATFIEYESGNNTYCGCIIEDGYLKDFYIEQIPTKEDTRIGQFSDLQLRELSRNIPSSLAHKESIIPTQEAFQILQVALNTALNVNDPYHIKVLIPQLLHLALVSIHTEKCSSSDRVLMQLFMLSTLQEVATKYKNQAEWIINCSKILTQAHLTSFEKEQLERYTLKANYSQRLRDAKKQKDFNDDIARSLEQSQRNALKHLITLTDKSKAFNSFEKDLDAYLRSCMESNLNRPSIDAQINLINALAQAEYFDLIKMIHSEGMKIISESPEDISEDLKKEYHAIWANIPEELKN